MEPLLHDCTCPHGERPLGMLYGISLGQDQVRLDTTPRCPEHDSCHHFTVANRAADPRSAWGALYCPIHRTQPCPA